MLLDDNSLGTQQSSLSKQALQQHYATMAQNNPSAASTGQSQAGGGGGGMPPMGLMQQFMGGGSGAAGGGATTGGVGSATAGGSSAAAGGSGASSGAMAGLMSNPFTAMAAAIAGNVVYQNNKGISSYKDSLMGRAGGNTLDYYGGRDDGKTHGMFGKVVDKDGATGQWAKSITDLSELDFSNAWKNHWESTKSTLKFKLF